MHPPAGAFDVDDDRVVNETFDERGGDDGVTEIVAELLEIDVRGHERRSGAITGIDDLEEESGVPGFLLLDAVKTDLVNQQNFRRGVDFELVTHGIVRPTRQKRFQHLGCRGVATAELLRAGNEQKSLGNMAFSRAGIPCKDQTLLSSNEIELGQFHDLSTIDAGLKIKIEIGQELTVGKFRLLDPPLDTAINQRLRLDCEKAFQKLGRWSLMLGRPSEFMIKNLLHPRQFQCLKMASDLRQRFGIRFHEHCPPV